MLLPIRYTEKSKREETNTDEYYVNLKGKKWKTRSSVLVFTQSISEAKVVS